MNQLRLFAGIWIGLFFLFLPFPFEILPEIGAFLSKLWTPLTAFLTGTNEHILAKTFEHSDSIHKYTLSFILGVFAAFTVITLRRQSRLQEQINSLLPQAISYILAFFLIKYGIEKIAAVQFPEPTANILYTPAGQLDKDIFFWSSMGTSKFYGWFMGSIEIIAGILLIIPRTRNLGAFIATGIFTNVLAINIGFDISVKLLSAALLSSSVYLIAPALPSVYYALMQQKNAPSPKATGSTLSIPTPFKRATKGLAVLCIFLECTLPHFASNNAEWEPNDLPGHSFTVTRELFVDPSLFPENIKRLHFHSGDYLILETEAGDFESREIRYHKGQNTFKLLNSGTKIDFYKRKESWIFKCKGEIIWICDRLKNDELPLLRDSFHWTIESMMPD